MPVWLEVILEIIKVTVPALIVFFTVYYLLRQFFASQRQMHQYELSKKSQEIGLPLKMQAYERLSLLCERISLPNMLLRIQKPGMSAAELRLALLVGIQQEYEHNVTQQVYVSEQLWEIIKLAKNYSLDVVSTVADEIDGKADARQLANAIIQKLASQQADPLQHALVAIKKEAALYTG